MPEPKFLTTAQAAACLQETLPGFDPDREALFTEGDDWMPTTLALLNAILDTIHPGFRLAFVQHPNTGRPGAAETATRLNATEQAKLLIGREFEVIVRPRNLPAVLRELADQIERKETKRAASES